MSGARGELISAHQRMKAAYRLRLLGHDVGARPSVERLARAVALLLGVELPDAAGDRTAMVRAFSQRPMKPLQDGLQPVKFVEYRVPEAMRRALARAHELYAIPSLPDRLEAEAEKTP